MCSIDQPFKVRWLSEARLAWLSYVGFSWVRLRLRYAGELTFGH